MPEGHSVHRLAAAFNTAFARKQVDASSPQGRFTDGAAVLDGRVLQNAEAYGKQMFVRFSGRVWLRVHLGLYGMWRFHGDGLDGIGRRRTRATDPEAPFPPEPRGAVRLRLTTGRHVADLSGPTACELLTPPEKSAHVATMGADPLRPDADTQAAYAKLHASRSALGLLLMRQDIIAGIGNIYRAEILFRHRLDPHAPGRALTPSAWDALWADLARLMADGVRTGRIVTTDPADRGGGKGRGAATYVAHRAGLPCRVCGNTVLSEPMAGRTLYWCPRCQTNKATNQP